MQKLKIVCVVGARPNFVKMAPIMSELRSRPNIAPVLIHTGQHYSPEMSDSFFQDLDIPAPDLSLKVLGSTHTQQIADIMRQTEPALASVDADMAVVVGDVNSTLAAALTAVKMGLPLAHVEAGLRSFDRTMPEEINRIVTDTLSDYLFTSEPSGARNLLREGVPEHKIFFVGNVMIDTLLKSRTKAAASNVLQQLGLEPRNYAVATLHRPSNVDEPAGLRNLVQVLEKIGERLKVVFPLHPRTRSRIEAQGLTCANVIFVPPLGYLDFLRLMDEGRLVLTDSGGIQEETTILGVPCLTLRENTERPITIEQGTNRLVGVQPENIIRAAFEALDRGLRSAEPPPLWDGHASARIADAIEASADALAAARAARGAPPATPRR